MAIRFKCTKCLHSLQVPDEHAGHKAKCPNCGQVLPVPAPAQPTVQPSGKPPIPTAPGTLRPTVGGPIPSLAKRKKPGKAKPKRSSRQTQPSQDQGPAPQLRSGKKPVIFGAVLAGLLVLAVVGWQMGWFKTPAPQPEPPTTRKPPRRTRDPVPVEKPSITVEMLRTQTDQLELQLAILEGLLAVGPTAPNVDQALVEIRIRSQSLAAKNLGPLLDANKKWLYEKVLARARTLVGQYRFSSAKKLLEQVLPARAVSKKSDSSTASRRTASRRSARTSRTANWQLTKQACRDFANGELIRQGLQGQLCIWLREEVDKSGQRSTLISLDEPQTFKQVRGRNWPQQKGQQKWATANEHLAFIRKLQEQALARQDTASPGRLYAVIRDLQNRCMTFETPGEADDFSSMFLNEEFKTGFVAVADSFQ